MLEQQTASPVTPTRAYPRLAAGELRGLKAARLKYGQDVSVINLSAGGVLFETTAEIRPDSTIVLEFAGRTKTFLVPSRVLRCQHVTTTDNSIRSTGACAFKRPLPIHDLIGAEPPAPADRDTRHARTEPAPAHGWREVIGRYRDGRLLRGFTNDFSPMKPFLHVAPTPLAYNAQFVSMIQLDAIFFVRDGSVGAEEDAARDGEGAATRGRRVAVTLPGGTELVGTTLNYRRDGSGFFVHPLDGQSSTSRVFITQSGIRNVRFL